MPLGWGSSAAFTTGDPGAGRQFTRLRAPLLLGATNDLTLSGAGASVSPPHIVNVSTAPADFLGVHAGQFLVSSATTVNGLVYLMQSTFLMTSSGGTSSGPTPTPAILKGAALMYDSVANKLIVFSTVNNFWMGVTLTSS